jgi:hypothetical protein
LGGRWEFLLEAAVVPDHIVEQGDLMALRASMIGLLLLAAGARAAVFDPTFGVAGDRAARRSDRRRLACSIRLAVPRRHRAFSP